MKSLKLGKLPKRHDPRTIILADYIPEGAPPIPPTVEYWQKRLGYWGMMLNADIGDCTIAAAGHLTMLWTAYSGDEFIPSDGQIEADYSAITGYVPGDSTTDQGAVEIDVLNYWRKQGMMGRSIEGYAAIDITKMDSVKQAIFLFGGIYIGFSVPQSAMDQFNAGAPWDAVPNDGGLIGGHAIPIVGYDASYLYGITWGAVQKMTPAFWAAYVDEAYAVSSPYWLNKRGVTPAGFGVDELRRDLKLIAKRDSAR
jgi:hypothetical protein